MGRSRLLRTLLAGFAALGATAAWAGALADLAVVDTSTGERLAVYAHGGRHYVAGAPGRRYAVAVENRTAGRVVAVISVDGVNVISGETAAPSQLGYVLSPFQQFEIAGWRKSSGEVAAFYFTALPDSYAARTGRARNVGVIGVAVFREATPPPASLADERAENPSSSAPPRGAPAPESAGEGAAPNTAAEPRLPRDPVPLASDAGPAPANAAAARAMQRSAQDAARTARLGTGHGERIASLAERVVFRRATPAPEETLVIFYDSRANLVARGIIPAPAPVRAPLPFPGGFVPDPRG